MTLRFGGLGTVPYKSVSGRDSVPLTAELDVLAQPGAKEIVLDSNGLEIARITDGAGRELQYQIGEMIAEGCKGAPLTIALDGAQKLRIEYRASADADALQWLSPEQTKGGVHPFLFSQGQAILNRTWIPTQDSPGIRQTWEARITAPKPLDVVMSGVRQGEPRGREREGERRRHQRALAQEACLGGEGRPRSVPAAARLASQVDCAAPQRARLV